MNPIWLLLIGVAMGVMGTAVVCMVALGAMGKVPTVQEQEQEQEAHARMDRRFREWAAREKFGRGSRVEGREP